MAPKPKLVAQFETDEHSLQTNGVLARPTCIIIHSLFFENKRERESSLQLNNGGSSQVTGAEVQTPMLQASELVS